MELENLDKTYAGMWRWVRRNMSYGMLKELTNKDEIELSELSDIAVDKALRDSYDMYVAQTSLNSISDRSKIKSGVLPESLGIAILEYSNAIRDAEFESTCKNIFGDVQSQEHAQKMENKVSEALVSLCNEISKVR
jgi:hypothetical protein